jgi:hypothetical protein
VLPTEEIFRLAQRYRSLGDINRASALYREIIRSFPNSEEAKFARVQLGSHSGFNFSSGLILLPFPLDENTRTHGGVEFLTLGERKYRIAVPQGIQLGHKLRLRNIAHHIDPLLQGDVHLLVSRDSKPLYQVRRDVQIDFPLDVSEADYGKKRRVDIDGCLFDVAIPQGAKQGTKIYLRNKAEIINGGYAGDIVLRVVPVARRSWSWLGFFDQFISYGPSKFSMRFGLPWFFEIGGEWEFKRTYTEIHMGR